MSDYELTAEPWLPAVPDEPFRDWDDVMALDDVPCATDPVDAMTLDGAV